MRFALVAFGTRGDVQPLVALGVRLRADGHEVVVGASEVFGRWVREHGFEFHTVGRNIETLLRRHSGVLIGHDVRAVSAVANLMRDEIDASFEPIVEAARGADLLVSGVHPAAPSAAEALGIPSRTLLYCPQLLRSRHHPPPGVPWLALPQACNELLWDSMAHTFDLVLGDTLNRHRRQHGLRAIASVMNQWSNGRTLVASDAPLGGLPPDVSREIVQIGSLHLEDGTALDPALERFFARGEAPVCFGFGSMPDTDRVATTLLLLEALAATGRRGLILSGWSGLGLGGVPPGVFVSRAAPHAAILPRVALVVHHGGAGTTAAVARAGVPQIVVPHVADQYYWGEQVFRCGLGSRPIPRRELRAERLAEALGEVLASPEIAERARILGSRLAGGDGAGTLARILYAALPAAGAADLAA